MDTWRSRSFSHYHYLYSTLSVFAYISLHFVTSFCILIYLYFILHKLVSISFSICLSSIHKFISIFIKYYLLVIITFYLYRFHSDYLTSLKIYLSLFHLDYLPMPISFYLPLNFLLAKILFTARLFAYSLFSVLNLSFSRFPLQHYLVIYPLLPTNVPIYLLTYLPTYKSI